MQELLLKNYLKSELIQQALLKVPREIFIPRMSQDYAYHEVPLSLPTERAIISSPQSFPLFFEPFGLDLGNKYLELDTSSGFGMAAAREVVGVKGRRIYWNR